MKGCMGFHPDIYSVAFSCNLDSSFISDIAIDEVKEAVLELISSVPVPSRSMFLAGDLYYDLCGRLILNGRLNEQTERCTDTEDIAQKRTRENVVRRMEDKVRRDKSLEGKWRIIVFILYQL